MSLSVKVGWTAGSQARETAPPVSCAQHTCVDRLAYPLVNDHPIPVSEPKVCNPILRCLQISTYHNVVSTQGLRNHIYYNIYSTTLLTFLLFEGGRILSFAS